MTHSILQQEENRTYTGQQLDKLKQYIIQVMKIKRHYICMCSILYSCDGHEMLNDSVSKTLFYHMLNQVYSSKSKQNSLQVVTTLHFFISFNLI